MVDLVTKLKNKNDKFNSQSVREACARALSTWNELIVSKDIPQQSKEDYELLAQFSTYAVDNLLTDSSNSHKPPSQEPNREKRSRKLPLANKRKPGGQPCYEGQYLHQVDNPDEIICIRFTNEEIASNGWTVSDEVEVRQVYEIRSERHVTEYQAQVCYDQQGNKYVAPFPEGVNS